VSASKLTKSAPASAASIAWWRLSAQATPMIAALPSVSLAAFAVPASPVR
jgi:hypothetical protein